MKLREKHAPDERSPTGRRVGVALAGGALAALLAVGALNDASDDRAMSGERPGAEPALAVGPSGRRSTVVRPAEPEPEPDPGVNRAPGTVRVGELATRGGGRLEVVSDELLVRFRADLSPDEYAAFHARYGTRVVQRSAHHEWRRIRIPQGGDLLGTYAALRVDDRVRGVSPNAVARGAGVSEEDENMFWQVFGDEDEVEWEDSWDEVPEAPDVVVAVLDSGVAYEDYADAKGTYARAPDLECTSFVPGYDFVNDDAHANDDHQHGTHITALIATHPDCGNERVHGYAPGVQIMPVKVLDEHLAGTEVMLAEGIRFAVDNGAHIINLSLAFGDAYQPSPMVEDAIAHANQNGVILVGASGNSGGTRVAYPAAANGVIAVGAFAATWEWDDDDDEWEFEAEIASYSSGGAGLDVLAAGGDLTRDLNGDGVPDGVIAQTFAPGDPTRFGYYAGAGTSQAAAAITGVAALLLQGGLEPGRVHWALVDHTEDDDEDFHPARGAGAVDVDDVVDESLDDDWLDDDDAYAPNWYVNVVITIEEDDTGARRRGVAAIELVDEDGDEVKKVNVHGTWSGASSEYSTCRTDGDGVCHVTTGWIDWPEDGTFMGFSVEAAARDDEPHPIHPLPFFRMDRDTAEEMRDRSELLEDGLPLGFRIDPEDPAAREAFRVGDRDDDDEDGELVESHYVRRMHRGSSRPATAIAFDTRYKNRGKSKDRDGDDDSNDDDDETGGTGLGSSSFELPFRSSLFSSRSYYSFGSGLGASSLVYQLNNSLFCDDDDDELSYWRNWGTGLGASSFGGGGGISNLFYGYALFIGGMSANELVEADGSAVGIIPIPID